MKYYVVFAAIVAIATPSPLKPVSAIAAQLQAIVAAIKDPNTEPSTAHFLEHILEHIHGNLSPVSVGPAIVDFPLPDTGAATVPVKPTPVQTPVQPSPVVIGPIAPGSPAPLVQIIVNVKSADSAVVPVAPVVVPETVDPVIVVDEAVNIDPVQVIDVAPAPVAPVDVVETAPVPVEPVDVVETAPVPVEPVDVIETAPVAVEPVIVGTPILPSPAVILPEELN